MGQVRSACGLLDDYAVAVKALNTMFGDVGVEADPLTDASDRLWASPSAAAEILNELNGALAELEQIRVYLVLGRPLASGPGGPEAAAGDRSHRDHPAS
ncbi:MAG: hypothetical protein AAF467_01400 [Actinomycetota bacterium]